MVWCDTKLQWAVDHVVLIRTSHNSADSVPTSNLVYIKEVAISTTFCIAGIIYHICNLVSDIQCTRYKNAFNKRIVCQNTSAKINSEKIITVCNAVYFRLCIDLMHVLPPVTAEDSMASSTRGLPNGTPSNRITT